MKATLKTCRFTTAMLLGLLLFGCASTTSNVSSSRDTNQTAYDQHVNLAKQYIGLDKRNLARLHLRKAENLHDTDDIKGLSQLYNSYALLYQIELEMGLAEKYFLKAMNSDPSDSVVRYNFSSFLFNQGRFAESLEQILLVSTDLSYQRRPQAFFIAGLAQNKLNDRDAAIQSFKRAIELSPQFNRGYFELAKAYFEQKRYLLARDTMGYYKALSQDTAESLWLLVRIEFNMGDSQAMTIYGNRLVTLFGDSEQAGSYQKLVQ